MKLRSLALLALPLVAIGLAAPARAALQAPASVACGNSYNTTVNAGYTGSCQGPLTGGAGALATFGAQSYTLKGSTDDLSGVFSANPGAVTWGTLALTAPQTGHFVLGIQTPTSYSLYLFDGGSTGIDSLGFDIFGTVAHGLQQGGELQRAAIFTPSAVPEPGSEALILAGLAALGFVARRRRV